MDAGDGGQAVPRQRCTRHRLHLQVHQSFVPSDNERDFRYSQARQETCYCCGEIYSYTELGEVCTKAGSVFIHMLTVCCVCGNMKSIELSFPQYCVRPKKGEEAELGQDPIIQLPFNWGDGPDSVKLDQL